MKIKKHYLIIAVELILFGIISTKAATTVPATGVSYSGTTVQSTLDSLITKANTGDATAAQILTGKKALVQGTTVTGTMANQGAKTASLNAGGSYTIPAGYHNGSGKVTANSLASQTSATATAADIASGKTAYVNGTKLTGTGSGYKVLVFEKKVATVETPYEFTGSWVNMGYEKYSNCSGGNCDSEGERARFTVDIGVTPENIVSAMVELTADTTKVYPFRYTRGYASGTTTAQYWYLSGLIATVPNGWAMDAGATSTSNVYGTSISFGGSTGPWKNKLFFDVYTNRGSFTNGTTKNTITTSGTKFYLSGYIIYK